MTISVIFGVTSIQSRTNCHRWSDTRVVTDGCTVRSYEVAILVPGSLNTKE